MWNPFKRKNAEIEKDVANLANLNLFQYIGDNLPIINDDANEYINRWWRNISAVYTVTTLISEKVYQCPIVFYEVKDKRAYKKFQRTKATPNNIEHYNILKAQALTEVDAPQALEDLINQPNPQQRWSDFLGVFCLSYLLTGNAYVYKDVAKTTGRPISMYSLNDLKIMSGGVYEAVKAYYQFWETANERMYPAETIYHAKTANPSFDVMGSQLYGVSPLRAALEQLRTIEESHKQTSKQMRNGGVLGLFSPSGKEDQLTSEQRKAFLDKFKGGLRDNRSFNKFMISNLSLDYNQIGLPPADLDLLNIESASMEAIYRIYKVPLARLNQDAATYNNQSESNKQLCYDAIFPLAKVASDMLTNHIGKHFDVVIQLDGMQLPEMSVNMKEQLEWLKEAVNNKILTPDEARYQLGYSEFKREWTGELYHNDKPLSKIWDGTAQQSNNNNNNI